MQCTHKVSQSVALLFIDKECYSQEIDSLVIHSFIFIQLSLLNPYSLIDTGLKDAEEFLLQGRNNTPAYISEPLIIIHYLLPYPKNVDK